MSLMWHYVSFQGQEYGPYPSEQMRYWYDNAYFGPHVDKLLVRLANWRTHVQLVDAYRGDRRAYFVAAPYPPEREADELGHRPYAGYPPPPPVHHGSYGYGYPPPTAWGPYGHPPPPAGGYPPPPALCDIDHGGRGGRNYSRSPRRNGARAKQRPENTPEDVLRELGESKVHEALKDAVLSLYQDRIKPLISYVRGRLKERSYSDRIGAVCLGLAAHFSHSFLVSEPTEDGLEASIELTVTPPWFQGWVDIDDPTDIYDESMWQELETYLRERELTFAGGRYGMAKDLHADSIPCLKAYTLGEICRIVQLAIATRKIIVYHRKVLRVLTSDLKEPKEKEVGAEREVPNIRELCLLLCRMCIRRGFLRLEQLRKALKVDHDMTINETIFDCTKLSDVMKLEPIQSAVVLESTGRGMRIKLAESKGLSEYVLAIHAEAKELEASAELDI